MIHVYGTSHVSEESFDVIDHALDMHDPEVVALELDGVRLQSMLKDQRKGSAPVFARFIKIFQDYVGSKTGVMPGEEMKYAYNKALEKDREIALVDQDIRVTMNRLKNVRRKEKVKAAFSIVLSLINPRSDFDVSQIPEDELINELTEEMESEFPEIYNVLMIERNQFIVEALNQVNQQYEGDVVAFLGAAHVQKVQNKLDETKNEELDNQGTMETKRF